MKDEVIGLVYHSTVFRNKKTRRQERKKCKGWEITGQREDFGGFILRGRHFWVILSPSLEFVCSRGKCLQCPASWPAPEGFWLLHRVGISNKPTCWPSPRRFGRTHSSDQIAGCYICVHNLCRSHHHLTAAFRRCSAPPDRETQPSDSCSRMQYSAEHPPPMQKRTQKTWDRLLGVFSPCSTILRRLGWTMQFVRPICMQH